MKYVLHYWKNNLQALMEYRTNFIIQTVGMAVNDAIFLVFWLIIFNKFGNIQGYEMTDILIMFAFVTTSFGLADIFFGNWRKINELIISGNIDYYLSLPKNVLLHMLVSKSNFFGYGDFIFGIICAFLVLSASQIGLFIILVITSLIIFLSISILSGALAFFMQSSEKLNRTITFSVVSLTMYPLKIFGPISKFILLTIIPAGFISGVPLELIKEFSLIWFVGTIFATIFFILLSIIIFNYGLKRYESGSAINVRE